MTKAPVIALSSIVLGLSACGEPPKKIATSEHVTASMASTESAPLSTSAVLMLSPYVGQYPHDGINYLQQEPLASRLKQLLKERYAEFEENLGVVSPLNQEGALYYLSGNKPHEGGEHAAALVIDPKKDVINVYLLKNHQWSVLVEKQQTLPVPQEIQQLLQL